MRKLVNLPSLVILSSCLVTLHPFSEEVTVMMIFHSCRTHARSCQIRNDAGSAVNFYWMNENQPGDYIKQTKSSLPHKSSAPLKTYEGHRFFAAWAEEDSEVMTWDPESIPLNLQFVHRGFDQVITAKADDQGALYLDDWDIHEGEMIRLTKAIANCTSEDAESYAKCIEDVGNLAVGKLEQEKDMIERQTSVMKDRLKGAWCGKGQYHSPALDTFEWEELEVELLADTPDVSIYHIKEFIDEKMADAIEANAQDDKTERLKEVWPNEKLTFDAPLVSIAKQAEDFIRHVLPTAELSEEKPGEPLRFSQYVDGQIHAPPCDGNCPLMAKSPTEYVGTLVAYPKLPKKGGQWKFELPSNGGQIGFVPQENDAVVFVWKTQGYKPELLRHLTACPLGEGETEQMLVVSRWIEGSLDGGSDEEVSVKDEL